MRFAKNTMLVSLLIFAEKLLAQAPAGAATPVAPNPEKLYDTMTIVFYIAVAVVFLVSLWAMLKTNQFMYKTILRQQAEIKGLPLPVETVADAGESFWEKIRKKYWEDAVPIAREQEILLDHGYDGIRELDNSLPPWWINMFYLTIFWAVIYMFYYHWGGDGPSSQQEYEREMSKAKLEKAIALASQADAVNEANVAALTDASSLADGKAIYTANCVACHGTGGEGGVGPNFADEYWLHGGGIQNVFKTVKYGVPDKGMIAWSATLRPSDIQKVASYILTFKGTSPANPKAPQGEIWKEEVAAPTNK